MLQAVPVFCLLPGNQEVMGLAVPVSVSSLSSPFPFFSRHECDTPVKCSGSEFGESPWGTLLALWSDGPVRNWNCCVVVNIGSRQRKAFSLVKSLILNRSMTLTLKSSFAVTGFVASPPELVAVTPAFAHSGLFLCFVLQQQR